VKPFEPHGRPEAKTEKLRGPYTVRTAWPPDGNQLISTSPLRTKDGKGATLILLENPASSKSTMHKCLNINASLFG
jgi:hypothetical protein